MEKSIFTRDHAALIRLLRKTREAAGMTQVQLSKKLRLTQSLYSKMERGEVRIDVIQLRTICRILGVTLVEFIQSLERDLAKA
jgi:transcriptional regulator with XRE-family HTH domain